MKTKEKQEAIRLRKEDGMSMKKIAKKLGVANSSVSLWVRKVPLSELQKQKLCKPNAIINVNELTNLVDSGMTTLEISRVFNVSKMTIRYHLSKNGLKLRRIRLDLKKCRSCGNMSSEWICRSCISGIRRFLGKANAIIYKGGKCERCGWSGHIRDWAAFEFHHLNDKSFEIGAFLNLKWEAIVAGIDKCELLCSNCHKITHDDKQGNQGMILAAKIFWELRQNRYPSLTEKVFTDEFPPSLKGTYERA